VGGFLVDLQGRRVWALAMEFSGGAQLSIPALTEIIFRTSRRPALLLDLSLQVKVANLAFYAMFRLDRSDVEGRFAHELYFLNQDGTAFRDRLAAVVRDNNQLVDLPVELEIGGAGSRICWLNVRRIDREDGTPEAVFLSWDDVTAQEEIKEKASIHTQDLERSNADLEQFAYVASHDLQEPLRMIGSYTQLLAQRYRGKLDADADDFIRFAVEGVSRMQSLIDGLLAYSRIERKGGAFKETNCGDALVLVQADLQQVIAESRAVITSDPLPTLLADARQIKQLLQNLISNALKFHKPGASPRVHISAHREKGHTVISVSDNGIGIAENERGRLFQLFQRLHNRSEYPGTGIGLAISKKIVERHGGKIWLESEAGKGTTFYFTLPWIERESAC
jgi:signal transduction histidine kinase